MRQARELYGIGVQSVGAAAASLFPALIAPIVSPSAFKGFSELFFLANLSSLLGCLGIDQLLVRRGRSLKTAFSVFATTAVASGLIVNVAATEQLDAGVLGVVVGSLAINLGNYLQTRFYFTSRARLGNAYAIARLVCVAFAIVAISYLKTVPALFATWLAAQVVPIAICVVVLDRPVSKNTQAEARTDINELGFPLTESLMYFFVFSAPSIVLAVERAVAAHVLSGPVLKHYIVGSFALSVATYCGVGVERHLSATFGPRTRERAQRWMTLVLACYVPSSALLLLLLYQGVDHMHEWHTALGANVGALLLGGIHIYLYFTVAPEVFRAAGRRTMAMLSGIGVLTVTWAGTIFLLADRMIAVAGLPIVIALLYAALALGSLIRFVVVWRDVHTTEALIGGADE